MFITPRYSEGTPGTRPSISSQFPLHFVTPLSDSPYKSNSCESARDTGPFYLFPISSELFDDPESQIIASEIGSNINDAVVTQIAQKILNAELRKQHFVQLTSNESHLILHDPSSNLIVKLFFQEIVKINETDEVILAQDGCEHEPNPESCAFEGHFERLLQRQNTENSSFGFENDEHSKKMSHESHYRNIIKAKKIIRNKRLDLLVVPQTKYYILKRGNQKIEMLVEERLSIKSSAETQQIMYQTRTNRFILTLIQTGRFICSSDFRDVTWRNIPIIDDPIHTNEPFKIGLIDLEECTSAEIGLFGAGILRRGLLGSVHKSFMQTIIDIARRSGVSTHLISLTRPQQSSPRNEEVEELSGSRSLLHLDSKKFSPLRGTKNTKEE